MKKRPPAYLYLRKMRLHVEMTIWWPAVAMLLRPWESGIFQWENAPWGHACMTFWIHIHSYCEKTEQHSPITCFFRWIYWNLRQMWVIWSCSCFWWWTSSSTQSWFAVQSLTVILFGNVFERKRNCLMVCHHNSIPSPHHNQARQDAHGQFDHGQHHHNQYQ